MGRAALFFLLILTTSCGYHFGSGGRLAGYRTITVPYVVNDPDGHLTSELVRELSASGPFQYRQCGGALLLQVRVCGVDQYNVGFEYDTDDDGFRTERIVPNEGRLLAIAEVEVVSCASGCVLLGPQRITASVDFDYDPLSTENQLAIFSLGQFTQIDLAEDTAIVPLYRHLARKIVNYVTNGW